MGLQGVLLGFGLLAGLVVIPLTSTRRSSAAIVLIRAVLVLILLGVVSLVGSVASAGIAGLPGFSPVRVSMVTLLGETAVWQRAILLSSIFPLVVFLNQLLLRPTAALLPSLSTLFCLLAAGLIFIQTVSLLMAFVSFELLLLTSLYLLQATAKSERIGDAVTEMFFWTLVGSLGLFVGFGSLMHGGIFVYPEVALWQQPAQLIACAFLLGFGVKLPLWPCFSWLLRAHVEASVEFSILLSGLIVKFGVFGIYRFSLSLGGGLSAALLGACSLMGILEACFRLLGQRDLKRIVALTTVIELNWIGLALASGGYMLELLAVFLMVAHSFTTAAEFFFVEALYKRYHTRDLTRITGLAVTYPQIWLCGILVTLVTIGFPGSSLFLAKVVFFANIGSQSFGLFVILLGLFMVFLPIYFMRVWVPIWFGAPTRGAASGLPGSQDLSLREAALFCTSIVGAVYLGLCPLAVLGNI